MPLKLNNLEEIYAHFVYLLDPATLEYIEVRDLIGSGGGSGGSSGGVVQSANAPLSISNGVLSLLAFPDTGIPILSPDQTAKTITVSNNGGVFVSGSELVHLSYLLNTYSPSELRLKASNNITRLLEPQLDGSLEWDSNTIITLPALNQILNSYVTSQSLTSQLSNYTTTADLTTLLTGNYQPLLTAGNGIDIDVNNVISVTGGGSGGSGGNTLILQLNGTTQSGATTLNFLNNNATFSNNVLNVGRLTHYDKIPLFNVNPTDKKDLIQNSNGKLSFDGVELVNVTDLSNHSPTTININDTNGNSKDIDVDVDNDLNYDGNKLIYAFRTFTNITVSDPLSIVTFPLVFGGKSIRIDTKWKPSTVSSTSNFFTFNASDSAGTLGIDITEESLVFDLIELRDGAGTIRNITADQSGKILII